MIIPNDNNNNDNNVHILVLVLTYLVSFLLAFCGAVIVGKLRVASGNWQKKDKDLDLAFSKSQHFQPSSPITQSPFLITCHRHHRHASHH